MKRILNTDPIGKYALQGYDPVAFHSPGKAVKANPYIFTEYAGYNFLFSSEENKTAFIKDPEKYLPAFGGYCAFGIGLGVFFPVEIDTWEIIDGKLVLNYSHDIKAKFHEDTKGNLQKAKENWAKTEA